MQKVLAGKIALITGANQGLGLEIAKKYYSRTKHIHIYIKLAIYKEMKAKK